MRPSREVSDARRMSVLGSLGTSVRLFHRVGAVGFHGRAIWDGHVHDLAGLGYGRERPFGLSRRVCQHIGTKIQIVGRLTRSGPDLSLARFIFKFKALLGLIAASWELL